jgi:Carboxypeptidase regulatory-like domain/TonB-dependent Receptor Plug Domain
MTSFASKFAVTLKSAVKHGRLRSLLLFCLVMAGLSFYAAAQTATVVGTVTDPSGSVVPNVTITATHTETAQAHTTKANDAGQYLFPDLPIGHYTIKAEASGFGVTQRNDVVLNVGDRARIDFDLKLGAATETITVEADAVRVQSENGEVSSVITGQQVQQLATNGRSMYSLANLTPGASSGQADFQTPTPVGGDAAMSFNGQRQSHNLYMLDGSESSDRGGGGGSDVMPSMDSIAEFRMLTSNYSAEYGLSSAATMTAVIRSGTTRFHASAWEFLRNDALDARNYFNPAPAKVAELRFNTYGFNVGGQVPLWKSHPTFFFYNMEWRSLVQGGLLNQTVPLPSTYGGDFGSTLITVPTAAQVSPAILAQYAADGLTPGQPFPNNKIPTNLLDPNAQALLAAGIFPAPTSGKQFIGGINAPTNVREEIARVDHQFTDKFSIFGHWVSEQISQTFGTSQWSGDNLPTAHNTFGNPSYSAVIHTTYAIRPNLLNEVAFNYNGNRIAIIPGGVIDRPAGFTTPELFPGNNLGRIPEIKLGGVTGADYTTSSWPWNNKADDYQIRDDISWTKGAHQFKIGGSWAIYKKIQDLFGQTQGGFTFNNTYTGVDFADFLLGYAQQYTELAVQDSGKWNNVSWAAYIQDNWRATKRLTLNLGLRWDGVPHTYEADNRMGNFYPNLYNPANAAILLPDGSISPLSPGLGTSPNPILAGNLFYLNGIGIPGTTPGVPKGLVDNHWAAFGPRLGFAYDLTGQGKTVIRGGFGTMYERIQGNDMYNAGPNIPFSSSVTFNNGILLANPSTSVQSGTTLTAPITVADITGLNRKEYKLPVSYQYSAGVQQAFGAKSVLSVSYVGNQSRHQNDYRETNLPDQSLLPAITAGTAGSYNSLVPFLGFHSIKQSETVQNGHYNSLQAEFRSQMTRDLSLQAAYTLSKAEDPATGNNNVQDLNAVSNPYSYTYDNGPSNLDRRHIAFVNFIYEVPFLKNSSNKLLKSTVGGWQVSGIVSIQSGNPINITEGGISYDPVAGTGNITNTLPNSNNRPNVNGSVRTPHTVNSWFDTSAFSDTAAGLFGNFPRNSVYGPGRQNWNLAFFKSFVFSEDRGSRLELRAETFNTFNHTQFKDVSNTFSASNFGAVTTAHDPREIQLGVKLIF